MRKLTRGVATDTCILFRFLHLGRMDLLGATPDRLVATNFVGAEITYPEQQAAYRRAISDGHIDEVQVDKDDMAAARELGGTARLRDGELSVFVVAQRNSWPAATQDHDAISFMRQRGIRVVTVQDIVVTLIRGGVLTVEEADGFLEAWASRHSFDLRIGSFRNLMG